MAVPPRPGPGKVSGGSLAGRTTLLDLLLKGLPGRDFTLQEFPEFLYTALLPIGAFLVAKRGDLHGFRLRRHLLDPLLHLLQAGISLRSVLRLVTLYLLKRRPDLTHLLLGEGRHVPAKRCECFLLLLEVTTHLVGLLDEPALQFLLGLLEGRLRGVKLTHQLGAELLQFLLVLPGLVRQFGAAPLELVRLITHHGGQRLVLLLCLIQCPLQLVAMGRELVGQVLRQLTESRGHLLQGSVSARLVLLRRLQRKLY